MFFFLRSSLCSRKYNNDNRCNSGHDAGEIFRGNERRENRWAEKKVFVKVNSEEKGTSEVSLFPLRLFSELLMRVRKDNFLSVLPVACVFFFF